MTGVDSARSGEAWPESIGDAAYHGLVGDIVRAIEPHTEADPVALLVQLLVGFGNAVGRRAYFIAEADRHHTNAYLVLVGLTAKGRKGSSWGHVRRLLESVDPGWASDRIVSGLSSGEGLVFAVRDPVSRAGKDGDEVVDEGVTDKRLQLVEPEFAAVLRVAGRDGSTLSAQVRQGWDSGNLSVLTKNNPAKATGAHISLVGHITQDELRRELSATDAANGFANRFGFVLVRRSKLLPEGGRFHTVDVGPFIRKLTKAVTFAQKTGEVRRDDVASERWRAVYPELSAELPGLLGALTSRAEPMAMRFALIYALLDRSSEIRVEHLEAGLAVWRYCFESAAVIFGDAIGHPEADRVLGALRASADPLTRSEIRDLFQRHASSARIDQALDILERAGLAQQLPLVSNGGRPAERWVATRTGLHVLSAVTSVLEASRG